MKHQRLWVTLGIFGLLAAAGSVALPHAQSDGDRGFSGGSYVTTIKDSAGNFASRWVITLHADQTMSVDRFRTRGPDILLQQPTGLVETGRQRQDSRKNDRLRLPAKPRMLRARITPLASRKIVAR